MHKNDNRFGRRCYRNGTSAYGRPKESYISAYGGSKFSDQKYYPQAMLPDYHAGLKVGVHIDNKGTNTLQEDDIEMESGFLSSGLGWQFGLWSSE